MTDVTTNFNIPLPGATVTSKRLADIQSVRAALGSIDTALASVNGNANDKVGVDQLGVANGVATLNANGLIPESQLPSFVDDVIEFNTLELFPVTGEAGKIYVATGNNKTYRWSGSTYIEITSGAVDTVNGKNGVVVLNKGDIGLGNVDNTADINKPVSTQQLTAIASAANAAQAASTPITHAGAGGGAHSTATNVSNGFMSATDKVKLDSISGINTGDQWSIPGNAGTATKLQTARNINGVPFDGSADITIAGSAATLTAQQIGFGSAGNVLTGSTKFTWNNTTNTLLMGDGAGNVTMTLPAGTVRSTIQLVGQDSPGGTSTLSGGNVLIRGGNGNSASQPANGGDVNINGGFVQNSLSNGNGGSINLSAGSINSFGSGVGGNITLNAGASVKDNVAGGSIIMSTGGNAKAGTGLTRGGSFQVWTYSGPGGAVKNTYARQFMIRETGSWVLGPSGDDYSANGPGTVGQVIMSNGPDAPPSWGSVTMNGSSMTAGNITIANDVISSTANTITIDPSGAGPTGLVVIAGDLQVTGTTTTLDSTTVTTNELNITIAKNATTAAEADGAGLSVAGASANFTYSATTDRWNLNKGLSIAGSLNLSGTGSRITGDFTGTLSARTFLQTSSSNGISSVGVLPSGTATTAIVGVHNSSDPVNSSSFYLQASSTDSRIVSDKAGTGVYQPITIFAGGAERLRVGSNGDVGIGGANFGTAGQVFTSGGAGVAPSWQAPIAAASTLTGTTLASNVVTSSLTSVGTLTSLTVSGAATVGGQSVGYLEVPQNAQGSYTLALTDSGKHLYTATGGITWTIPANSVTAFKVGTVITFVNKSATTSTIAITSDTMIQNKIGPKTSLALSGYGMASAIKVDATTWMIAGDLA